MTPRELIRVKNEAFARLQRLYAASFDVQEVPEGAFVELEAAKGVHTAAIRELLFLAEIGCLDVTEAPLVQAIDLLLEAADDDVGNRVQILMLRESLRDYLPKGGDE